MAEVFYTDMYHPKNVEKLKKRRNAIKQAFQDVSLSKLNVASFQILLDIDRATEKEVTQMEGLLEEIKSSE